MITVCMCIYIYIIQSQCSTGSKLILSYSNAYAAQRYTSCSTRHVHLDCTTIHEQIYTMNAADAIQRSTTPNRRIIQIPQCFFVWRDYVVPKLCGRITSLKRSSRQSR